MWFIVLAILGAIYFLLNVYMTGGDFFEVYFLRPILFVALAIITILIANNEGLNILKFKRVRRWSLGESPIHAGLLLGGFQVAVLIITGIMFGFGKSPYSQSPTGISINLFYVISVLLGTELSRAYLIKKGVSSTRKYTTAILVSTTIIYMLLLISPEQFSVLDFSNPVRALEFIGNILIVSLCMNLLASYLSYLGGATASIGYMGIIMAFQWFSPILPKPHWTMMALVGTIAPALGFIILQDSIAETTKKIKQFKSERRKEKGHSWTLVAVFAVIIIFFSYGYLGVEPTVIYSGSMQPTYEVGDIVIVGEVNISEIQKGDIIQFVMSDNRTILIHRVVDKVQNEKGTFFITKGDANDDPDLEQVSPQQILGKAIFTVPKIGWIQICVKDFFRMITSPFK